MTKPLDSHNNKYLVTGATGFIGQHLVPRLLAAGYHVRCLCRSTSTRPAHFAEQVEWAVGDLSDTESLKSACRDVDVVIHLAGAIKALQPDAFLVANTQGTVNLLQALEAVNPQARFIYISSLAAAGPSTSWQPKTEEDPAYPVSMYGQSKLQAEIAVLRRKSQRWVAIVRPAVVYGPGDRETLIYYQIGKSRFLWQTNPLTRRISMIYVADLVELIWQLSLSSIPSGELFFAADSQDHGYSWNEVIGLASVFFPRRRLRIYLPQFLLHTGLFLTCRIAPIFQKNTILNRDKHEELKSGCWTCSGRKARELLGFKPQFDLKSGMEKAVQWYQEHQWL